jgi:preprotein translocase subunit SecD
MNRGFGWKLIVILGTLLIFVYGIFGMPSGVSGSALVSALQNRINLGLDLKGGTHLILQVHVNDAINVDTDNAIEILKAGMRSGKINYAEISKSDPANHPEQIVIKAVAPESGPDLRNLIQDKLPDYDATSGANNAWTVSMKPTVLTDTKERAVQQAIQTIDNRINELGVSEPVVEEHGLGQYQILVQLPGVDDPARVKNVMQSTAMLEIKQEMGGPYPSQEAALQDHNGVLPTDSMLLPGHASPGSNEGQQWYLVSRVSAVRGKDLRDAQPSRDQNGQPSVSFTLSNEGGQRFYSFTSQHVGDSLAVVLDNKVQEVATIHDAIRDRGEISGGRMTEEQARDLALILRSGALPAGISYLEERTVGPSLGTDSIRAGVRAAVVGMVAVLVFMLIYYRWAGVNADVALVLNLIILLGFLGFTGATLTLPGIAGVILTVGMGVDSNVLIFERIREELRNGKTPPSAVEQGFGHALTTIIDTHVTTIVSAAILFLFGTGPVKGFAITLSFGLFANLFTAVFVSRVIFDWVLSRKRVGEALSI